MLDHVADPFLHDAEETERHIRMNARGNAVVLKLDGQPRLCRHVAAHALDRGHEAERLELEGVQLMRQLMHFGRDVARERRDPAEAGGEIRRVLAQLVEVD
jgi:hypothetical protein